MSSREVSRGANTPPPPVKMTESWTFHDCPSRLVHTSGWYFPLFEEAIRSGRILEHARVRFPKAEADELEALVVRWTRKRMARLAVELWGKEAVDGSRV